MKDDSSIWDLATELNITYDCHVQIKWFNQLSHVAVNIPEDYDLDERIYEDQAGDEGDAINILTGALELVSNIRSHYETLNDDQLFSIFRRDIGTCGPVASTILRERIAAKGKHTTEGPAKIIYLDEENNLEFMQMHPWENYTGEHLAYARGIYD